MILIVTLIAAFDVTYTVDRLVPHTAHRVRSVAGRAGGKGVNVARTLAALGHDVVATGFTGGPTGAQIRADLARVALRDEMVPANGESRRTLAVVADGDATLFNEPGAPRTAQEWQNFCRRYAELVREADTVVCSGSVPPGIPTDAYAVLIRSAHECGVRTIIDADGPVLAAALAARPFLVKPNAAELIAATGVEDPVQAARALGAAGADVVVASLGPEGLVAVTGTGAWRAHLAHPVDGNPTGAGDACVAALAAGLTTAVEWPGLLREAVALSAAAVRAPLAGDVDLSAYHQLLPEVAVRPAGPHPVAVEGRDATRPDR